MNWRYKNWKKRNGTASQRMFVHCGPSCNQLYQLAHDHGETKNTRRKAVQDLDENPDAHTKRESSKRLSDRKNAAPEISISAKHIKSNTPWLNLWKK